MEAFDVGGSSSVPDTANAFINETYKFTGADNKEYLRGTIHHTG